MQRSDLGLTKRQAVDFLNAYFAELRKTHGAKFAFVVRWVENDIQRRLRADFQAAARQVRGRRPVRPGAQTETEESGGIGRGLAQRWREGSGKEVKADREQSLFDSETNAEIDKTVARDRDLLQGQRLKAQFNSPISAEENAAKLKRRKVEQGDLFKETPANPQGTLFSKKKPSSKDTAIENAKGVGEIIAEAADDILKVWDRPPAVATPNAPP